MNFFKSIGTYTIVNILDKAVPFLMLPVLTRYLSPNDFGMIAMFLVFISFLFPFVGLNIHGAVTRQYIDREKIDIAAYITNALYILAATSILLYGILFLFEDMIETYFHIGQEWFFTIITITISMVISETILSIYNIGHKPIHYGIYRILRTVTTYSFIIVLVMLFSEGWEGRVLGQLYGEVILAIIGLFILFKANLIHFSFNISYIKNALLFGIPLIPHAFGAVIISMSDRLLITNLVGLDATGVYVVAIQIGVIVSVIIGSIKQAWTPHFFDKIKNNTIQSKKEIVKYTYFIILIFLILTTLFSFLIQPIIPYLVDEKFVNSKDYIFWIVMGIALQGIYHLLAGYMFYLNKTYILMILTFIVSILNIFFSYYLIQINGPVGAAQGTFYSYLIITIITWYKSNEIFPMSWNIFKWRKNEKSNI